MSQVYLFQNFVENSDLPFTDIQINIEKTADNFKITGLAAVFISLYISKKLLVSALSKGGFSMHTNPVIMIARCQCFTSIVCQMNENASTLLQLWRSTMRAKRRTEQEQYEIIMECRQSGLSDHQWCLEHDINPGTFFTRSVVFASRLVNFQNQQKKTGFRRSIRKL